MVIAIRQGSAAAQLMTRLLSAVLVLALVSGCTAYFQKNDEVAFSGHGVLASYDQSLGDPADANRVGVSVSKRQMKRADLASDRVMSKRVPLVDFTELTVEEMKHKARLATEVRIFGESWSVIY